MQHTIPASLAGKGKVDFLNTPPPVNYVAGLGRGATGFTTRSDIGPARETSAPAAGPATKGKQNVGGLSGKKRGHEEEEEDAAEDYSESNFDEFEGYGGGFSDPTAVYEQDDKEADMMWDFVDKRMEERRKLRKESKLKQEIIASAKERPKIQLQFADAKRELSKVTIEEWDALPQVGDRTWKQRQKRPEKYTPAPDSLLEKARASTQQYSSVDAKGDTSVTPLTSDLTQIGSARKTMLALKLRGASDSVSGQTVVDPKGYLTDLSSIKISSDTEIGDIKKARLLLKSVTSTNPKHPPGWIAAARLEEVAGKISAARKIIAQGCKECPTSDDVWLEAARLNTPEEAKEILSRAVQHLPNSVKIWLYAASLEKKSPKEQKKILRRALEFIPSSVRLWKAAIELEEPEDAKVMLSRAVECVPEATEMWLALAKLENYENARKILNKARLTIPTDVSIWITAAELEEANVTSEDTNPLTVTLANVNSTVRTIIKRALTSLASYQVIMDREQWLKEAEAAEKRGSIHTCIAIVSETIGLNVEDEDRKKTWADDAEACIARGSIFTARAIYAQALEKMPQKKSLWLAAAHLEKSHGTAASVKEMLRLAVRHCPKAEVLWLMGAKEVWQTNNDVAGAREILKMAFAANPDSEKIWLAAVKLESENNEYGSARDLLRNARLRAPTQRVWLKSVLFERDLGNIQAARTLLAEALVQFPSFDKFWIVDAQLAEDPKVTREIYKKGAMKCPHSIPLWLCYAELEETQGLFVRARSVLEQARLHNPKNPQLWVAAIRVELKADAANGRKIAMAQLAKALQECPNSGLLWAEAIEMEPKAQQKARLLDAMKKCDNDPYLVTAVAKIFWQERKIDKARDWFNRAVGLNPDLGDTWAFFYKFEVQHGNEEQQANVIRRCVQASPRYGENWTRVSKAVENRLLKLDQILKQVALRI